MEKLKGIKLPNLNFSLKKMGDFLFHEGPIQSHFINEKDENFIAFWVDGNEKLNRWLFVKTEEKMLYDFFIKKENTVALIEKNIDGFGYLVDINGHGEWLNFQLVANADIPKSYFPSADSYYLKGHYEVYAEDLKVYLTHLFERKRIIYEVNQLEIAMVNESNNFDDKSKNPI